MSENNEIIESTEFFGMGCSLCGGIIASGETHCETVDDDENCIEAFHMEC